jgi:hypothetical protein
LALFLVPAKSALASLDKFTKLFFPRALHSTITAEPSSHSKPIISGHPDRIVQLINITRPTTAKGTKTSRCRPRRLRAELAELAHEEEVEEEDEEVPLPQQHHLLRQQNSQQPMQHQQQKHPHRLQWLK